MDFARLPLFLFSSSLSYFSFFFFFSHVGRDLSHIADVRERAKTNFDHPDSLETSLLVDQLAVLKAGGSVDVPTYDFTVHCRAKETMR